MAQLDLPITPELAEKLASAEPWSDDIDLEALGLNVTQLSDQLAQALHRSFSDSMKQATETLDSVQWYHPGMLIFYIMILGSAFIVFRAKSNIPSVLAFFLSLAVVVFSELINITLHDLNAQLFHTITAENIFDLAGLFFTFEILPPFLFLMCTCLFRWLYIFFSNNVCKREGRDGKDGGVKAGGALQRKQLQQQHQQLQQQQQKGKKGD